MASAAALSHGAVRLSPSYSTPGRALPVPQQHIRVVDVYGLIRSSLLAGLCYDQPQVWMVTDVVTLPDILPCVLRGGEWNRWQGQFLTRILAHYQAIVDITTYVSRNKLWLLLDFWVVDLPMACHSTFVLLSF